jgi:hypothetical protein
MAAVYALANGTIQQFYSAWAVEQAALAGAWPEPAQAPSGPCVIDIPGGQIVLSAGAPFAASAVATPVVIEFDESTNASLVADIIANFGKYAAPGGVLQKSGSAVPVTPASAIYAARAALATAVPATGLQSVFTALNAGTATNAQIQQVLAYLLASSYTQGSLVIPTASAIQTAQVAVV